MPELPEVESLRRSLSQVMVGTTVRLARLARADMLHRQPGSPRMPLAAGARVVALHRHGKQMAIEAERGGCLLVHLGMSGSLRLMPDAPTEERHVHACWCLERPDGSRVWLRHRDPRRFGWLESHADLDSVRTRSWSTLGPDALEIQAPILALRLKDTRRALKAVLLDQDRVAGLGNIYVDEALHRAQLHPCTRASSLQEPHVQRLAKCVRQVLQKAVQLGGSTIQDHRTADGSWGSFQRLHQVYGRAGEACLGCASPLQGTRVVQRATVFCPVCQPRRPR